MTRVKCGQKGCKNRLNCVEELTNKCKCENVYCNSHKGMDDHNCTAIEKARAEAQANLEKLVEKVVKDKIVHI
jgi:predicted nucleic acid binding AN1-type Zn finger protein